jgi:DGQHR domain-containing protein
MPPLSVNAIVLKQRDCELYCFGMSSEQLSRIAYVTPRWTNNPREIQRVLNPRRVREIGKFLQQPSSLLPNAIVVSLTSEVRIEPGSLPGTKVLTVPDTSGKFAYVLDGQHRLEGFRHSGGVIFDLPVVAIRGADDALRGKVFADINSKQVRVSGVHLLSLYDQINELSRTEARAMDLVRRLNRDADSPLRGRVRMADTDHGAWIASTALARSLAPYLTGDGVLATGPIAGHARTLEAYVAAVAEVWPEAWGKPGQLGLCRPSGLELMLRLFGPLMRRLARESEPSFERERFAVHLRALRQAVAHIPGGGELTFDWRQEASSLLANRALRASVARQLEALLAG